MYSSKVISNKILNWKCEKHPNVSGDFICLDGDSNDRVLCFNCVQKQKISVSNLVQMNQVLAANQHEIMESYPPLKDQELSEMLRDVHLEQQFEGVTVYFKKLREDFEQEVKEAEQRVKEIFIQQQKAWNNLLEGYARIAEVEKLKELIVSEKESAQKDLDDFIKEKWRKAEENRQIMAYLINKYEGEQCLSFEKSNKIAQEIIKSLEHINFFQQSFQEPQVTFIKSTIGTSQSMEIIKVENSIYQIKQGTYNGYGDQVFLDPILDPLKKYILHIELEQKPGNNTNHFLFGLMKDEGKDNSYGYCQNMSYYDQSNGYGITKMIKGSSMQSGTKLTGKHSFEVRIFLNEKYLRVACLPDYSSVAELDDRNKIDPKVHYRFFLSMVSPGDMMRIINIKTVCKFDKNI